MSLEAELKKFELSSVFTINFSWLKRYVESDNGMYTPMKNISDDEFREIENSLYALQATWKAWREAKAQAVPEGFVLAHKELPEHIAESMALERVELPSHESSPTWAKISEDAYKGRLHSKKWELWRDYKEMIQAQEQGHD